MIYGYARVSTEDQKLDLQIDSIRSYVKVVMGEEDVTIFAEKQSGAKADRPELQKLMDVLKEGDTFIVYKLDRLARTTKQLYDLHDDITKRGVHFISLHENINTTTTMGKAMFGMIAVFAEMERNMINERTREGKAIAKLNPNFKEGRPNKYTKTQLEHALSLLDDHSYTQVADMTGISKSTLTRARRRQKLESAKHEE